MTNNELKTKIGTTFLKLYHTKYIADIQELCQGENKVLFYLYVTDKPETYPSDIARDLLISKQRVTYVINSLNKKGWCSLEHSQEDRRRIMINITPLGEKKIEEKQAVVQGYFDLFIETIGADKIYELADGLEKAINQLMEIEKNGVSK